VWLLFGGFCVKPDNIRVFYKWAYWSSFFQYAFTAATINEFEDLKFTCDGLVCPYPDGTSVLDYLDIEHRDKWWCIYTLCMIVVVLRIINYLVLRFLFKEKN
jgi:hypothetical protein